MTFKAIINLLDESYMDASRVKSLRKFLFTCEFAGISGRFKLMMLLYLIAIFIFIYIISVSHNWIVNILTTFTYLSFSLLVHKIIRNYFEPAADIDAKDISHLEGIVHKTHYEEFKENLKQRISNAIDNIEILIETISLEIENRKTPDLALYLNVLVVVAIPLVLGGLQETVNKQPKQLVFILYIFFLGALLMDLFRNFIKLKETRYRAILKYLVRIKIDEKLKNLK